MNQQQIFMKDKHIQYLNVVENSKDFFSYGGIIREHLGVPGAYWGITSCYLIKKKLDDKTIDELWDWLMKCQNEDGGFGGNVGHDSNLTCTLYILIISMLFDRLDSLNKENINKFVMSLYDEK